MLIWVPENREGVTESVSLGYDIYALQIQYGIELCTQSIMSFFNFEVVPRKRTFFIVWLSRVCGCYSLWGLGVAFAPFGQYRKQNVISQHCSLLLSIVLKGNTATEAKYITWSNHHDLKGSKYSGLHFLFVSLIKMYICICFSFLIVSTSQMRPHCHTSRTLQTFPEKKGLLFPNPLHWLRKNFGPERRKCSFVKGGHNILDII